MKKTWDLINDVLNKTTNKKKFPDYFKIGGDKVYDKAAIANHFNNFFSNIGPALSSKIRVNSSKSFTSFLLTNVTSTFSFDIVSSKLVTETISKLKPKSSSGHDLLSTYLLKRISHIIVEPLTLTINQSLITGIFPDSLKIAEVIPLFKKDDPQLLDNYRPVSLLPAISKVFEKIVFKQVYQYFTTNKLLYKSQYGFRNDHSTDTHRPLPVVGRVYMGEN